MLFVLLLTSSSPDNCSITKSKYSFVDAILFPSTPLGSLYEAAIREVIEGTLAELGLAEPTAKDKGKLMKALMPKVKDKADGALVNRLVGTHLK